MRNEITQPKRSVDREAPTADTGVGVAFVEYEKRPCGGSTSCQGSDTQWGQGTPSPRTAGRDRPGPGGAHRGGKVAEPRLECELGFSLAEGGR